MFQEELDKYGDIILVQNMYNVDKCALIFKTPAYSVAELAGLKLRAWGMIVDTLAELGAASTWLPGPELYTSLATGVLDGLVYSNSADYVDMAFYEVTDYWLRKPLLSSVVHNSFIVNADVWRELPDDLKSTVEGALEAATWRNLYTAEVALDKGWVFAEDYGIEMIEWPAEDQTVISDRLWQLTSEYRPDAACEEFLDIVEAFMIEMGYF